MNAMALIPGDIDLLVLLITLSLLIITIIIFKHNSFPSKARPPLPPGPYPWPIVGNMFQLSKKTPHITLAKLAQVHGPLMMLKVGARPLIVGSSPAAAKEILVTHDRVLSGRCVPHPIQVQGSILHNLALAVSDECDDGWKRVRTIYRTQLLSTTALESQVKLREKKVVEMVKYLGGSKEGQVVSIRDVVFSCALNIVSNAVFSMDFVDFEGKGVGEGMNEYIRGFAELCASPQLVDMYPILGGWDFQRMYKNVMNIFQKICAAWVDIVKERRNKRYDDDSPSHQDFTHALISTGLTDEQINPMLQELFSASTESTSLITEWALTELIRNQEAMQKVRNELAKGVAGDTVRESDLPQLPYLEACVKETLRLHPPAPLLLPHRAVQTCQVMGYTIPEDSRVLVNIWAIGRDPTLWNDPSNFKPERFLKSNLGLGYMGKDFEYLPFGSGRRMCPGQPLALRMLPLILASLLHHFDWVLPIPTNVAGLAEMDMTDKLDMTLQKEEKLRIIPKLRRHY
ncbi:Corytuberine synthase [Camellia lanceoleosa]|uniref:Corytuberine synthase n=1 Tax=Camellia lanceoleosa TaxID=1840588 RepID=A0ACC0ISG4_9ERIC|nr:Corytuberine synthase [Camellia lanceoleosa]